MVSVSVQRKPDSPASHVVASRGFSKTRSLDDVTLSAFWVLMFLKSYPYLNLTYSFLKIEMYPFGKSVITNTQVPNSHQSRLFQEKHRFSDEIAAVTFLII